MRYLQVLILTGAIAFPWWSHASIDDVDELVESVRQEALLEDEEGAEILPQIRKQLVALLEREALTPRQRVEAGDALGVLGDPRPGVCTLEPELIEIPAGMFIYQDRKYTIEQPFAIARYPVTVAQFAMFMEDDGYEEARYWGGEESAGWQWRLNSTRPTPRSWTP